MARARRPGLWLHQLQLTVTDFVKQITIPSSDRRSLDYEDQKPEAKKYAHYFLKDRAPKYLGYFESVLQKSGGPNVLGRKFSYVDLSLFQLVEGLRYAFPSAMKRIEKKVPRVVALRDKLAARPCIKAYTPRVRLTFNEWGIFRHYPELDDKMGTAGLVPENHTRSGENTSQMPIGVPKG